MARSDTSGDLRADRRYAYAAALLSEGDAAGAAEMAEQALELAPGFAAAWHLLGEARLRMGDAGAVAALTRALDLDPADRLGSRVHLARLGAADPRDALSPAYVQALFDGYAPRFEAHLVGTLHYRGPEMLRAVLDGLPGLPPVFEDALDLGCGTGLMGAALEGRVGRLAGNDLSPAMLARAASRGCYARLVPGDLLAFLRAEPAASADLVTAADVFIYLGDLHTVLGAIARVLRPDGAAAFTVQSHDGPGVAVGTDGRVAHADATVRDAAAGASLSIAYYEPAAIRRERGAEVPGRLVVLQRTQ